MTVLRTREIIPKSSSSFSSSPKPPKSQTIEPSTPSAREKPSSTASTPSSASQSHTKSCSVAQVSDSEAVSASPVLRRSARLASRLGVAAEGDKGKIFSAIGEKELDLGVDEGNGSILCSGSGASESGRKRKGRVSGSGLNEGKLFDSKEEKEIGKEMDVGAEIEVNLSLGKENVESSGSGLVKGNSGEKQKTRASGLRLKEESVTVSNEVKEIVEDHGKESNAGVESDESWNVDCKDEDDSESGSVRWKSVEKPNTRVTRSVMKKARDSYFAKGTEGAKETKLGSAGDKENDDAVRQDSMANSGEVYLISGAGSSGHSGGRLGKGKRKLEVYLTSAHSDFAAKDGVDKVHHDIISGPITAKKDLEDGCFDFNRIKNVGNHYIADDRIGRGEQRAMHCSENVDVENQGPVLEQGARENELANGKKRYSRKEKGKEKLVKESWLSIGMDQVDFNLKPEDEKIIEDAVLDLTKHADSSLLQMKEDSILEQERQTTKEKVKAAALKRREERGRYHDRARGSAARFAHFEGEEGVGIGSVRAPESQVVSSEADQTTEDWPGPFSTAMKIINDRKLNARQNKFTSGGNEPTIMIEWTPSKNQRKTCPTSLIPSLRDICLNILAKHAEAIVSLKGVPDLLRNKLSHLLCDSRKMDCHFMNLLVSGSPTEICVKDCSWMTEEHITKILGECDLKNLTMLQLDLCGRCMPDYILRKTLAQSLNSMPALVSISLRGAYRLTDVGLDALVASAPGLRSVNLGECSLITSIGICNLAFSLGSSVRGLYLDDCQNVDATLIIPALKKLEHLEVLSVAGIQTVCDDFICKLVPVCGPSMKELVLANCGNLTDKAMQAIAETCSGLRVLDIFNLRLLTDLAIVHLSTGCRSIQTLKLGRSAFSDEAIAAFLEASGESLTKLSLKNVKKVGPNTAISISRRCSRNLQCLDLSWCRNITDKAAGLIVDSCLSLRVLELFGCTQITSVFLDGHSNSLVQIIGPSMTPILQHLNIFDD